MEPEEISIWKDGHAPTSAEAFNFLADELRIIQTAMGYTTPELELNRISQLSKDQRRRVINWALSPMFQGIARVCVIIAFLAALGGLLASMSGQEFARGVDWRFLAVLFIFVMIGTFRMVYRMFDAIPDLVSGEVLRVQGRVYGNQRDSGSIDAATDGVDLKGDGGALGHEAKTRYAGYNTNRRYFLEIEGLEFAVSEEVYTVICDDANHFSTVRGYYTPRTRLLMSMEPVALPTPVAAKAKRTGLFR